jgi:hypothetical protein
VRRVRWGVLERVHMERWGRRGRDRGRRGGEGRVGEEAGEVEKEG